MTNLDAGITIERASNIRRRCFGNIGAGIEQNRRQARYTPRRVAIDDQSIHRMQPRIIGRLNAVAEAYFATKYRACVSE